VTEGTRNVVTEAEAEEPSKMYLKEGCWFGLEKSAAGIYLNKGF
jgi:hypothetical protein